MKKSLVAVLVSVAALGIYFWVTSVDTTHDLPSSELVELRIPDTRFMGLLPLYVAEEKGIFEKAGIRPSWLEVRDPRQAGTLFFSDKADLLMSTFAGLLPAEIRSPGTLRFLMPVAEPLANPGSAILALPGSGIGKVEDLRGRSLGTYTGPSQRAYAQLVLRANDLEIPEDVELVQVSSSTQVQGLLGGAFDALFALEPYLSLAKAQGAVVVSNGVRPRYISDPFWIGAVALKPELADNTELRNKLLGSLREAVDEIKSDPKSARDILVKRTSLTEEIARTSALYDWITDPSEQQLKDIDTFFSLLHKNGLISETISSLDLFIRPQTADN